MIISLTIDNFKSIRDEQTLNLSAENLSDVHQGNFVLDDENEKRAILCTAGLWGPNASGKSNVLLALKELKELVSGSHLYELDQPIKACQPFRLDDKHSQNPVTLELDFIGRDGFRYIYRIRFTWQAIIQESLVFYPAAKPAKLFERTSHGITFGAKLSGLRQIPYRENQSYLSVAAQHQQSSEQLKNVYRFFRDDIHIVAPGYGLVNNELLNAPSYRQALAGILSFADTGITQVGFDQTRLPVFYHENSKQGFGLEEESAGIRRLYEIAPMLIYGLTNPGVWLVDELDCQLHPRIAELIVMLFHDKRANQAHAQLIFTTHNTSLMNSDLFRRDQVWFTQKQEDGATELVCLDEYGEVRGDTNFEKWYRQGRFEAVPEVRYNELLAILSTKSTREGAHAK
ncbi:MAG: ATP-binding protein [Victivallales bacterium]|nr:ATP-binding protein [Victivallales bacterium]